jgi:hypothetical protein
MSDGTMCAYMSSASEPTRESSLAHSLPLRSFGLAGASVALPGGEGRTYRVGQVVLRRENEPDRAEASWLAGLFAGLTPHGFRVPHPLPTVQGDWVSNDGWAAWTFLEGRPATRADVPDLVPAIEAFHAALVSVSYPAHLADRDSPYDRADRWAWSALPPHIDPPFAELVHRPPPCAGRSTVSRRNSSTAT